MARTPKPPKGYSTGLIPRSYKTHPTGYQACLAAFPDDALIPEDQWAALLDQQQQAKASLYDLRVAAGGALDSLDQDGEPLCWAFSSTKAVMYLRARMGQPPVRLSAWWVAGRVKGWQSEGGWGAESTQKIADEGVPSEAKCPSYKRSYDNADVSADAAQRKVIEWWDGFDSREKNRRVMISAFLRGEAPVLDYNHISHSMCGCRLVSLNPLVVDCDNSWGDTDQYGEHGLYRLKGDKAVPDGVVVPRVVQPSA